MTDGRHKSKPLWLESATAEEKAEIAKIDRRIAKVERERKELTQRRYAITNRCTVRTLGRRGQNDG